MFSVHQAKSEINGLLFDDKNATKTSFFYAEGILTMADIRIRTLCEPLNQLDRKNIGGEFSFEYQITSTIKGSFPRDTVSLLMIVILM
jgi:hypothetical protein